MSLADIFNWITHTNLLIVIPSIFGALLVFGILMTYSTSKDVRDGTHTILLILAAFGGVFFFLNGQLF